MDGRGTPTPSILTSSPSFSSSGDFFRITPVAIEEATQEQHNLSDKHVISFDRKSDCTSIFHFRFREAEQMQQSRRYKLDRTIEADNEFESEFEFPSVCRDDPDAFPITADDIFCNGQIRPFYPILIKTTNYTRKTMSMKSLHRSSLRKLMKEEEVETTSSLSSAQDQANELQSTSNETSCVWAPPIKSGCTQKEVSSPKRSKKSKCRGSLKRWKLKNLLAHSSGHGKDLVV